MNVGSVQSSNWQALQQTQRATAPSATNAANQVATSAPTTGEVDPARPQLSDDQKQMADVLYLSNTAQNNMDIYMAVMAEQNNQNVTWTVQPDTSNNLNFVTQDPNGEQQSIPYSTGSILNTSA
ncbi:hypothetical protein GCM10007860_29610 [Chitiniphilus shinanonensis]|uniref:Uncharacterized protein n=1 Tax=Chitiniphilus shinanonensis TaxID=553088 RepID=A0ABQ6BVQ5_9NEIS|nr:hypothetical protein [Chitiniphilus shinanonensis]GLS05803.1 hypothetical protein GCM10007860_29610 [Chitiniphilus shinanonensis]